MDMADEFDDDLDPDNETEEQPEEKAKRESRDIRRLREKAKKADEYERELADLRRKTALLEAGVDLSTPLGQIFAKGYDGELTVEAIRAEAEKVGALNGAESAETPATEPETTGPELTDEEKRLTEERRNLAAGAPADQKPDAHPKDQSFADSIELLRTGGTREQAVGNLLRSRAEAAAKGDNRVLLEP